MLSMAIDLMHLVTTFLRAELAYPIFLNRAIKLQLSCDLLYIQQTLHSAFNVTPTDIHKALESYPV